MCLEIKFAKYKTSQQRIPQCSTQCTNTKMNYFSKDSMAEEARSDRSVITAGLELHYNVKLGGVIGAGGQGDVYNAERKFDKLQVAIKVIHRSRLKPGPGVCSHLDQFKAIKIFQFLLCFDSAGHPSWKYLDECKRLPV
jgi:serine/threonine protein kinase